jgi:ApbE superfamily uncharacterized protein (UPF0280 family)
VFILGVGRPFGGCGKDETLIVFRNALAGFVAGEMPLRAVFGVGRPDEAETVCDLACRAGERVEVGSADEAERGAGSDPGSCELAEPLRE